MFTGQSKFAGRAPAGTGEGCLLPYTGSALPEQLLLNFGTEGGLHSTPRALATGSVIIRRCNRCENIAQTCV